MNDVMISKHAPAASLPGPFALCDQPGDDDASARSPMR